MKRKTLTSRMRVLRAIDHQEPDRVPFDLTLTVDIYHKLRAHLGLPPDRDQKVGIWADINPKEDLLDAMGVDFLYLGLNPPSKPSPLSKDGGLRYDQWGVGRKKVDLPNGSYYYEMVSHPLKDASLEEIHDFSWPDPYDPARVEGVRARFQQRRKETDKAIVGRFATSIWEQATYLCGLQNFLEMIALEPEKAGAVLDKTCEVAMGMADVGIGAVGDLLDIFRLSGEDMGTQNAGLISPRMYQAVVEPRFRRYWAFVRQRLAEAGSEARIMLHSCGSVRPYLPSWIEMGLNILDPVQPKSRGMEPEGLKRDFGGRLTFHGGIDTQELLPCATRAEVMEAVRCYIRILGPGGGYIVSPAHNVQSDVPPENLAAIRDAVESYGYYPLV